VWKLPFSHQAPESKKWPLELQDILELFSETVLVLEERSFLETLSLSV
jgi:hypothetical protein